jgi:hypothetical protein
MALQFDEETLADGNYSTTLSVVTLEPAGLSDNHTDKLRLLLVRAAGPPWPGTAGPAWQHAELALRGSALWEACRTSVHELPVLHTARPKHVCWALTLYRCCVAAAEFRGAWSGADFIRDRAAPAAPAV